VPIDNVTLRARTNDELRAAQVELVDAVTWSSGFSPPSLVLFDPTNGSPTTQLVPPADFLLGYEPSPSGAVLGYELAQNVGLVTIDNPSQKSLNPTPVLGNLVVDLHWSADSKFLALLVQAPGSLPTNTQSFLMRVDGAVASTPIGLQNGAYTSATFRFAWQP
jgi:hypothetical protein